jgi:uncharacterized protein (DUF927 family)
MTLKNPKLAAVVAEIRGDDHQSSKDEAQSSIGHYLSFGDYRMNPETGLTVRGVGRTAMMKISTLENPIWLSAPFEILGRVRDAHGDGWGRLLRWRDDDGRQHQHVVSDADLYSDVAVLFATLASKGLTISVGPAKTYLVSYLNQADIEDRITVVPRTGWHEIDSKTVFVPSLDNKIIVSVAASPFSSSGTLEDWQQSVGRCADGHDRAMFAIAAAFAGPLLYFISEGGGGFNLKGMSSIGKTSLLCASASVWGSGQETGGNIKTWRATGNGLEGTATLYNDALLPLDELGVASPIEVGNVVYSLAGGVGKQRAQRDGSAKPAATWRVIILSTGEIGIAEKIKEGGARVRAGQEIRIIDLDGDAGKGFGVFDSAGPDGNPQKLANDIKSAAGTYYGTAGPAFVRAIGGVGETVPRVIAEARATFRETYAPGAQGGQILRVADRFALVAAAGELAIELGILPWKTGSVTEAAGRIFATWQAARGGDEPGEIRAAIDQITAILEQQGEARFDPADRGPDTKPIPNRLGYRHGDGAEREWWILPQTWKTEFCRGLDPKAITKALLERGLLLPDGEGRSVRPVKIEGTAKRAYVLPAKKWFQEDEK